MVAKRHEISVIDRWDLDTMYPSTEDWEKDFKAFAREAKPRWPQLAQLRGHLHESPEMIKEALSQILNLERKLARLYTYAHLRHDEEITHDHNKTLFRKITMLLHEFNQEVSWFQPELLAISPEIMEKYLVSPKLSEYKFYLERIYRLKQHVLSQDQEELMALAAQPLQAMHKSFSAINDADFKFGVVQDEQGKEHELSHGLYGLYVRNRDRTLRKNAFSQLHKQYEKYENTLCELIQGQIQAHLFNARARKYSSCLEAALFPNNIDPAIYHNLISTVGSEVSALHKYIAMRQLYLPGIDQLHLYDMQVPLTEQFDMEIPFYEAEDLVVEAVAPLGKEYQDVLSRGFKEQRWVDRYENENKRSGAYSSGCYDSSPYILMNYKGIIRDLFTLSHEAGHSMHSYLSHKHQPYHYGDYSIFLAEVASTFNEDLLTRLLLERAQTDEERIFLINQKIEDIRGTLFRQTMFAEFELLIHQMVENGIPLTPSLLKEEYRKLNKKYFGNMIILDQEIDIEWARIPHFYYNFYVFQYATGISAALALAERVVQGGKSEREDYLNFLKGGSSRYPMEMLKMAGIDMRSPEPVKLAIGKFSKAVDQLTELLKKKKG